MQDKESDSRLEVHFREKESCVINTDEDEDEVDFIAQSDDKVSSEEPISESEIERQSCCKAAGIPAFGKTSNSEFEASNNYNNQNFNPRSTDQQSYQTINSNKYGSMLSATKQLTSVPPKP